MLTDLGGIITSKYVQSGKIPCESPYVAEYLDVFERFLRQVQDPSHTNIPDKIIKNKTNKIFRNETGLLKHIKSFCPKHAQRAQQLLQKIENLKKNRKKLTLKPLLLLWQLRHGSGGDLEEFFLLLL